MGFWQISPKEHLMVFESNLYFRHRTHLQRILSGLEQSSLRRRVGPLARDDCPNERANWALATASRIFGVFVGESLQGMLELHDSEAAGHVDVTLVVERPWRNKGLGWALLGAAMQWCVTQRRAPFA